MINTSRFRVTRVLIDSNVVVNAMSLKSLSYLMISVSQFKVEKITLKEFNENSEEVVGSIILKPRS